MKLSVEFNVSVCTPNNDRGMLCIFLFGPLSHKRLYDSLYEVQFVTAQIGPLTFNEPKEHDKRTQ